MALYELSRNQRQHPCGCNSNGPSLSSPSGGSGSSSKFNGKVWRPALDYSESASSAARITNFLLEDETNMDMAHEKRQETSKSAFDAPCSIFERKCPRCQPGLEQNDAGQSQNICSAPNHGIITSAGLSSQTSAAFCVPEGVAHSYNVCITEEGAEGEVRVGWKGYATRWKKGSVLRYIVCAETFPSLELAELTAREAAKAALMWQNIGVRFKKVGRDEKATFAIKYRIVPHDCRPDVYASAFFPGTSPGELFVYQLALKPSDVRFLANILAHEFGHILGLRHEFAVKPSFLWGEANDRSVMNYFSDLIQLQVGEQDRKDLATYYECEAGQYERLSITDIEPRVFRFPCVNKKYDINRYRSTRKRLYLKQFTQILLSLAFIRFCYDFAIFVSLACRAFLLG